MARALLFALKDILLNLAVLCSVTKLIPLSKLPRLVDEFAGRTKDKLKQAMVAGPTRSTHPNNGLS